MCLTRTRRCCSNGVHCFRARCTMQLTILAAGAGCIIPATNLWPALRLIKERRPDITVEGEMQADAAVVKGILGGTYPFSDLKRTANVLIFPNLAAANASYKLLNRLGGAEAIGPVLLGLSKPVHLTQRGATVADITNLAAISVVDAAQRRQKSGGKGES